MNKPINDNSFDCIKYKDRVQREIYQSIKNLSPQREIAYFKNEVRKGPFADLWLALTRKKPVVFTRKSA